MITQEVKEIAVAAPLTGYTSTGGTVQPTDSILAAIEKLNGNITQITQNNYLINFYNFT